MPQMTVYVCVCHRNSPDVLELIKTAFHDRDVERRGSLDSNAVAGLVRCLYKAEGQERTLHSVLQEVHAAMQGLPPSSQGEVALAQFPISPPIASVGAGFSKRVRRVSIPTAKRSTTRIERAKLTS